MTDVPNEFETLLMEWESGSLDEPGLERLREILKTDAAARSFFLRQQRLTAALQLESDAGLSGSASGESDASPPLRSQPSRGASGHPKVRFWSTLALSLFVGLAGGWLLYSRFAAEMPVAGSPETRRDREREATSQGVALVTRLVDVTWGEGQPELEVGAPLAPGRFAIATGHAQVEFFCGATVVIEGPAELELESATLARVRSGRLRAMVPPAARGFSLEVDDLKVVDLGTEFGLSVSEDAATVQVFDGEVELHHPSQQQRLLTAGQGVIRTSQGIEETAATPERFVDIATLESRAHAQGLARYERWKTWSESLRSDPRLIAYYSFDQQGDWKRRLAAGRGDEQHEQHEHDGAIVGAREVEGRWGLKRGLEFKQPADRVRVQIPGEYQSLSLACWVKIDSLDRWFNSLFLTDGYDKGEPHWQILEDGRIYFSVRPKEDGAEGPADFKALSPPFWQPALNGKWIHLAVTCDLETKTITHYLNGDVLSRHQVPPEQMPADTRIGTASIGNWASPTRPDARFAIRNLNGSIDELALFSTALSAEEIKGIYEHGKP